MAIVNPVGFLQNVGATHNAELLRQSFSLMSAGQWDASSALRPIGGVHRDVGFGMDVVQAGVPNMSVDVRTGIALVSGSESNTQGCYVCTNSATQNIALAASHATLARIDRICVQIRDAAYSGVNNDGNIVAITGTPSGSPSAPAAPANSLTLATISVPATDTAITQSQITDLRYFLTAPGGVIHCTSTNRPVTGTVSDGQEIYELDTLFYRRWNGSSWVQSRPYIASSVLGSNASFIELSSIPTSLRKLEVSYSLRSSVVGNFEEVDMRINNTAGGNYNHNYKSQSGTTVTGVASSAANHWVIGFAPGANITANYFGTGVVDITNWSGLGGSFPMAVWQTGMSHTSQHFNHNGQGIFHTSGPYTSVRILPNGANNWVTNSWMRVEGWE